MSRFSMNWSELSLQVMITFAHFLWQACVVGLVLLVVQHLGESLRDSQIMRRRRSANSSVGLGETDLRGANFRYTIACIAFLSLPICVAATFTWVHQSRGSIFLTANNAIETLSIPAASENRSNPPLASSGVQALGSAEMPAAPLLPSRAQLPFVEPIDKTDLTSPDTTWVERAQSIAPFLLIGYVIGVALLLVRFGISILGSSRLRRTLQPITDSNLLKVIAEQSSRLGLKRIPVVTLCKRVSVPVVVGIVKPMILLPPALLCGLDPNQIAAILSHELAHIRRYDLMVNLLQRVVEALLFFHPITWWISRRVSIERENCCDDLAAACMGRLSYAGALLQMAELCIGNDRRRSAALATLSASGGNSTDFGYRIRRLIGAEETTRVGFTRRSFSIGLALVSLLTISLIAWGQNQKAEDERSEDRAMQKNFTPEPLWQTKLAANDGASEMFRISPIVVAANHVLSIEKDFDLQTGKPLLSPFARLPRTYEFKVTLDPVLRRKSSDRAFIVEASVRMPGNTWSSPSYDLRVFRVSDYRQVGATITPEGMFSAHSCAVDVENGGDFLVLGMGNEVQVYRTETGQVETTMPVKTKRVDAVAISPDQQWLVVSDQNDLHFWRWRDQAPVKTIHAGRKIDSLVFTPDGQYLAEGPDSREDIQIRDMRTLEVIASLKDEVGSPLMVSSMDITPDGRYLVAHNEVSVDQKKLTIPHRIHVWDLQSRGKPVFQIATGEWVRKVAFSDDGRMIVGEFSGAAHGALLAAWLLPDEIVQRQVDSPRDAKDRLGDGIQWSRWGDENGLLSGARLIIPKGGLQPGQPLVAEYRLVNVSKETKTLKCYLNKGMQFTSLSYGNRIGGFGLDWHREPITLNIEPSEVFIDTEHLVLIDTTGLEPGRYHAALGSAFRYPDNVEPQTTHHISHFGSIPFMINGASTASFVEMPKSDIHWGKPIAGLQVGAQFAGDPTALAIGATIEADLFVANVTDQPIECSVVLPHPQDGWLFNVEDQMGHTIMLQQPIRFSSPFPQQYIQLKLAPGEIAAITGDQNKKDGQPSRPRAKFEIANAKIDEQSWPDYTFKGRLVTQGGQYSAIFDVVLLRPEIPAMRLELDSGNVPFTVLKPTENELVFNHAEEADKRTPDFNQTPLTAEELSGEWSAQTDIVGLKCQRKRDPLDKGVRPLDVSVKVEIKFDQSEEAISRYAQFRLSQEMDTQEFGGRKAMAGRLAASQDEKEVNLVYHFRKEGVQGSQTRTVGKICRSDSGELLLTLFPSDTGIFNLEFDDFAPVEKLKLVKRDTTASNSDKQSGAEKTEPQETEDSSKSPQRARDDQSSWIPARPLMATVSKGGSAEILDDHSVQLEGDVSWQEVNLQFAFDKPTNVEEIRLEILPVDSPTGPQFGRGGDELTLFDVKPGIEDQTGKFTSLDFSSCTYLQNPSDETTANCIDYLSDTVWKVPKLPADVTAHELVLRFEKPITLRANQRLTLTVDSGGAKELAALNRIRFAFRQELVAEPLSVNSTMNGSDVGASITTGGVNEKVEPWEISKLYEAAFLRNYLQDHEALPKPIVVPAVSGKVFDPNGNPASGVKIVSQTPRHWVDLDATLELKPHNSGGVRNSKPDGTFGLPQRTEPYRVLLVHESGVANVSHEELLRAKGKVTLKKWASVSGTLKLGGKPQAGETIVLHFNTVPWSYSRGGPRLTTTHKATTDRDGNFSFDRVPPLGGMAQSLPGHGAVYQCESGKNTHIEIGAGITVTGKLSFPEHMEKNKLKVYARNHLLPIPYPKDWTDEVNEEERLAWRIKWSSTAEGSELEDKNFILMNSFSPGSIAEDGKFTIHGVPEKPMVLVVAIPGEAILLEHPFDCNGSANETMDLGTLTVADHDHDHAHDHDEVKREDRPDKLQLPKLIVKTVDSDGKPVPGTSILFYDRNSHRAGQKQKFEMVSKRADESGVADFGVIPDSFGCLQLSSSKELAECYTLISTTMTKCTQADPPRANVRTEIKDGILTVTFTMTPHVDLEFNIVDDATDEIVFWSEIFYQDPTTDRWWQFGLVDGSKRQHNFIPISPQITRETIRISALGYETKVFRLPDELDRSKPIRRDVRLKPMPDVELKVLLPDGTPAAKAKLTFHYPNELDCLQVLEQLSDAQGIVKTKFPPNADIGIFRLEHTGGTAELSMKELLDAVMQNPEEVIQVRVRRFGFGE